MDTAADVLFDIPQDASEVEIKEADDLPSQPSQKVKKAPLSGVLVLSGLKCRELSRRSGFLSGALKPYARMMVEQTTHETTVKKDKSDPVFDGSFNFLVKDSRTAMLSIEVSQMIIKVHHALAKRRLFCVQCRLLTSAV